MAEEQPRKQAEFNRWMGPILDALRELGGSGTPKQVEEIIARTHGVTDAQRKILNEISGQSKFSNEVAWGRQYLIYEGLIVCPKRGIWTLTESGQRTTLSVVEARNIAKKWIKHLADLRKQRTAGQQQDDAASDTVESEAEEKPRKQAASTRWMGPTLDALRELGGSGTPNQVADCIARANSVADAHELIKSGEFDFKNQVAWGRQYLVYEGLLVDPRVVQQKRGIWTLTELGQKTKLSIDDSARIYKKWSKHHAEVRKQRAAGQQQGDATSGTKKPEYDLAACSRETNFAEETLARWIKAIELSSKRCFTVRPEPERRLLRNAWQDICQTATKAFMRSFNSTRLTPTKSSFKAFAQRRGLTVISNTRCCPVASSTSAAAPSSAKVAVS